MRNKELESRSEMTVTEVVCIRNEMNRLTLPMAKASTPTGDGFGSVPDENGS